MASFWKKVVFKIGDTKVKVWHLGALFIVVLLFYQFNAPFQFATIRGTNVSAELGSLKTTRNIANSPRTTVSGTFDLSGTSSRIDPDGETSGLPDLQISIRDFSVSSAKKDKGYNYGSDPRYRATISLHDFSYKIKVECESDRGWVGDTESHYYWYDVDLSMRIRVDDGWVGFEKLSMSDVNDDSNQVDFGDVSKDKDFDYVDIGSGSKDPSEYGLKEHCTATLRIKKADDNSGQDSYTATAKISGQIVLVTAKEYTGGGGDDDDDDDYDYTPPAPSSDFGDLTGIITVLGLAIIGFFILIFVMLILAMKRK